MKSKILILFILAGVLWLNGCYYDSEDVLYPCNANAVSYAQHIVPILESNCYSCHAGPSPVGGRPFDTYSLLVTTISDPAADFLCRIKWEDGCAKMPPSGSQLEICSITRLEAWIEQGMLNN